MPLIHIDPTFSFEDLLNFFDHLAADHALRLHPLQVLGALHAADVVATGQKGRVRFLIHANFALALRLQLVDMQIFLGQLPLQLGHPLIVADAGTHCLHLLYLQFDHQLPVLASLFCRLASIICRLFILLLLNFLHQIHHLIVASLLGKGDMFVAPLTLVALSAPTSLLQPRARDLSECLLSNHDFLLCFRMIFVTVILFAVRPELTPQVARLPRTSLLLLQSWRFSRWMPKGTTVVAVLAAYPVAARRRRVIERTASIFVETSVPVGACFLRWDQLNLFLLLLFTRSRPPLSFGRFGFFELVLDHLLLNGFAVLVDLTLKFRYLLVDRAELCASRLLLGVHGVDLGVESLLFYDEGL